MIIVFLGLYLAQIYLTKNGFPEPGIAGIRAAEIGAAEIRAAEVRSPKVSAAEIRAPEIRVAEVRVPKIGVAGVRAAEVRAMAEIRAAEIPPRKVFFNGYERLASVARNSG